MFNFQFGSSIGTNDKRKQAAEDLEASGHGTHEQQRDPAA